MKKRPIVIIGFIFLFKINFCLAATIPEGIWSGVLNYSGRTWDIGIQLEEANEKLICKFYSTALWRWEYELDSVVYKDNQLMANLPFDIGTLKARFLSDKWEGEVSILNTDKKIPITLFSMKIEEINKVSTVITNGDTKIGASLFTPGKKGSYSLITVIHGAGDSYRETPPIWFLANYYAQQGFACLIYDKRGNGESSGNWRTVDFNTRASDIITCLKWAIQANKQIDKNKIGLMAVSQGAWIADLVAQGFPEVDFIINVAAPLSSPAIADTYALKNELLRDNWNIKDIGERVELWNLSVDVCRHPGDDKYWNKLTDRIEFYRNRAWFQQSPYEPQRYSWFRDWYKLVADFDPMPVLKQLNIPVLWMYGNRDTQSDLADNIAKLNNLKRQLNKDYTLEIFANSGHGVMGPVDEYGNDQNPVTTPEDFFPTIVKWIKSRE